MESQLTEASTFPGIFKEIFQSKIIKKEKFINIF
jgi:hypothetical protein